MYFKTGDSIPEELEAARQKARQARTEANRVASAAVRER